MGRFLTGLLLVLLGAGRALADEGGESLHPYLDFRHYLALGVYEQSMHAEVGESRGPVPTVRLSLEDLDVDDDHTDISLAYQFRMTDRWSLIAATNRYAGDGKVGRGRAFSFGPFDLPVGVGIATEIEVDTYILDVLYRAVRTPRAELSVGAGLHAFDFYSSVSAFGQVVRNVRQETLEIDEFVAPLPNLRMQGFYAFTPRFAFNGSLGWLSVDIDEWDGDFRYYSADLSYRLGERFQVFLGYQHTDMDATRTQRRAARRSSYEIEFSGPSIHIGYGF